MRRALLAVVALVAALATPILVSSAGAQSAQPQIAAASWYLVGEDGAVLARHDAGRSRAIASITKLMTALVVLEHAQLDDVVRVSPQAAGIGESTVYLRAGEELTVAELLRATLIPSANDAAEALALHVGRGSADRFVELMNAKAERARSLRHALREPARARRAGPRLERARRDGARPLRARHPVHPRRALALERLASRRKDVRDRPTTCSRPGRRSSAERRATRATRAGRRRRPRSAAGRRSTAPSSAATRGARGTTRCSELLTYGLDQYRAVQVIDRRARLRDRRRRATASPTSSSSRRARSCARSGSGVRSSSASWRRPRSALPVAEGPAARSRRGLRGRPTRRVVRLVAAAAVPDAGVWAKAKWHATQTARNLWEMLT